MICSVVRGSSVNNSKGNKILSLSSREVHSGDIIEESSNDNDMNSVNVPDVRGEEARSEDVGSEDVGSEVIEESNGNMMTCTGSMKRKLPKMKTHVEFLPLHTKGDEENQWRRVYIHSRGGKATGKYANSLNIQLDGEGDITCVDWNELAADWKEKESVGLRFSNGVEEVLVTSKIKLHDQKVIAAKISELQKFKDNNVYSEVPDEGQETITVKWVITEKEGGNVKSRLVARGVEEQTDHIRKDSPTCSRDTLRILFSLVAGKGWRIQHIDVQAAFLQGRRIMRDIYIRPPFEAESDKLWKLNKCMYGLVDAPRMWYTELCNSLVELGMKVCTYNESFLYWHHKGELCGIMAIHVDDLLNSGSDEFNQIVMQQLKAKYKISKEVDSEFLYTGLHIKQKGDCIELSQNNYIDEFKNVCIDRERSYDNKLAINDMEYKELRSICGQLMWVSTQTRPDMAYYTCVASNSTKSGTLSDLKLVNKAINYLQKNRLTLKYSKLDFSNVSLVAFCDAAYGNLKDGSSQGAYIIFLVSKDGKCCPLTWMSKKIKQIVKSSLAGECWSMIEAIETCELMEIMLRVITNSEKIPIICVTDCRSLFSELHTSNTIEDKGLRIPIGGLRHKLKDEEFIIKWIEKDKQLADSLTKAGASSKLLREILCNGVFPEFLMNDVFGGCVSKKLFGFNGIESTD